MENTELVGIQDDSFMIYQKASQLVISDEEAVKLDEPISEMDIEIRPDGLIYPPQVYWRDKLNQTFGRGQWALVKHKSTKDPDRDKVYYDGSLFVRGCFVARGTGEAEYHTDNKMQSWASVEESAKSDCLGRCCKDLGIFKELWQPNFVRGWLKKYAVKVFIEMRDKSKKISWRRVDQPPYYNEVGIAADSPNHPKQAITPTKNSPSPKKERNYTAECEACDTLDKLSSWWGLLSPEEKKNYEGLKNHQKETILKNQEAQIVPPNVSELKDTIKKLTAKNADKNRLSIEMAFDKLSPEYRNDLAVIYNEKLQSIGIDEVFSPLPF
ncbi:MAG: hypothetical protein IPJ03_16990 [Ignavibacteriales bacterium]|nr:hypothetical protein [Ignavibacteriales bacterium]